MEDGGGIDETPHKPGDADAEEEQSVLGPTLNEISDMGSFHVTRSFIFTHLAASHRCIYSDTLGASTKRM